MEGDKNQLHAIVAVDENWAIGRQGGLLCHLPADMRHFKQVTMGHNIIMGRKTFESFPRRPLPGRHNIVITRNPGWQHEGVTVARSLDEAIAAAGLGQTFIIGGAQVYEQALPLIEVLHLTLIHARWASADVHFPTLDLTQWQVLDKQCYQSDERNAYCYDFITLKRCIS